MQDELEGLLALIDQDASGSIDYEVGRKRACACGLGGLACRWPSVPPCCCHEPSMITPPPPLLLLLQEFIAATLSQHQMEKAENMRAAFLHFDKDNSGTISKEELREALKVGVRRDGRGVQRSTAPPVRSLACAIVRLSGN